MLVSLLAMNCVARGNGARDLSAVSAIPTSAEVVIFNQSALIINACHIDNSGIFLIKGVMVLTLPCS